MMSGVEDKKLKTFGVSLPQHQMFESANEGTIISLNNRSFRKLLAGTGPNLLIRSGLR